MVSDLISKSLNITEERVQEIIKSASRLYVVKFFGDFRYFEIFGFQ